MKAAQDVPQTLNNSLIPHICISHTLCYQSITSFLHLQCLPIFVVHIQTQIVPSSFVTWVKLHLYFFCLNYCCKSLKILFNGGGGLVFVNTPSVCLVLIVSFLKHFLACVLTNFVNLEIFFALISISNQTTENF